MSRSTKLIILGIFLVLLAVPLVYVALTWHTPNPLRFHIVTYHPPGSPEAWPEYGKLDLRVENTSLIPVRLFRPGFARTAGAPGNTTLWAIIPPSLHAFQNVPPRGTASLSCGVVEMDTPPVACEHEEVSYTWVSDTTYKYGEICLWLSARMPDRLQEFIRPPRYFTDTTDLIPAKP